MSTQPRTPFPFQETAITRGIARNTYLALPCGLGKSLCAVEIAKRLRAQAESQGLWGFKVLICLSPKVALQQWHDEIRIQDCDLRVRIYLGDQCVVPLSDPLAYTDPCYVVIYYEQLAMFESLLRSTTWNVIVFDEAHFLNNRNAQRTQIAAKLRADRIIAMSATPFDKAIIETWSVLHLLYPDEFRSYWAFRNRYALLSAPREGGYREVLGTNPHTLAAFAPRLKAIMYRIAKDRALPHLPPLSRLRRLGTFDQLARMGAAHLALRIATEHARDLGDPLIALEHHDVGGGDAATRSLADEDVVVRPRRDLRQVRDGEDLVIAGDAAHRLAHLQADPAPDAGVDLIEDERRHVVEAGEDGLEREHDP